MQSFCFKKSHVVSPILFFLTESGPQCTLRFEEPLKFFLFGYPDPPIIARSGKPLAPPIVHRITQKKTSRKLKIICVSSSFFVCRVFFSAQDFLQNFFFHQKNIKKFQQLAECQLLLVREAHYSQLWMLN